MWNHELRETKKVSYVLHTLVLHALLAPYYTLVGGSLSNLILILLLTLSQTLVYF